MTLKGQINRLSIFWLVFPEKNRGYGRTDCDVVTYLEPTLWSTRLLPVLSQYAKSSITLKLFSISEYNFSYSCITSLALRLQSLRLIDCIFFERWRVEVSSLTGILTVHYSRCWRDFLRLEPVRTLKLWDHSQWNLYDQKEESFLFLTNVNIMCKTSLIMDK